MPKGFNKESAKWVDGIKEKEGYDGMEERTGGGEGKKMKTKREEREEKRSLVGGKRR